MELDHKKNKWEPCIQTTCISCSSKNGEYYEWDHDGHTDYKHRCKDCGCQWWVDGIDS